MYFSALKRSIQNLEEKRFYDVALMYLSKQGYRELSIVDGSGDGGHDVTCSRDDLRIQLSVRSKWEDKINEEVENTRLSGKRHLIYVTNRLISPAAEERFKQDKLILRGEIDVSIHDLNRISTSLAQPGSIRRAYEILGMARAPLIEAGPKEVAISTILLFGKDAKELRDNAVEAYVKALILQHPDRTDEDAVNELSSIIPGADSSRAIRSAISRLRAAGCILGGPKKNRLSKAEAEKMQAAEDEFAFSTEIDLDAIEKVTGLDRANSRLLLDKSLEILAKQRSFAGLGPAEEDFRRFLAEHNLARKRLVVYECLAKTFAAKRFQYGAALDRVFLSNTFDIYRALGGRTDLVVVLDTSVALPLIFGLEFETAKSRYGLPAAALQGACKAHNIRIMVPRSYLNEMAAHGKKALEFSAIHSHLPDEVRAYLRSSGNAYLSHFSHIEESLRDKGISISLKQFLEHFGVRPGAPIPRTENRIRSTLERHGVSIGSEGDPDQRTLAEFYRRKRFEDDIIVRHDAAVASMIMENEDKGFLLSTWDNILIDAVFDLARVYADTPARIIDFLSFIEGADYESDASLELQSALLHIDEKLAERLSRKIEQIKTADQAFLLQGHIDTARGRQGASLSLDVNEMTRLLDETIITSEEPAEARPLSAGD